MTSRRRFLGLLGLAAVRARADDADAVYPQDVSPPPGTRYPCALTALPRALPGIPEPERGYINRVYARLLRATQAKLLLLRALDGNRAPVDAGERYRLRSEALETGLRAEAPPDGLEPFNADVVEALRLQRAFFARAVALRGQGRSMAEVYAVPAGREASRRLLAAWSKMQRRYPAWSQATRDSIYHHLCALDLF